MEKNNILEVLKEQKDLGLKGNLYHNTQILFSYNTNHIEGSMLTEEQTRYIYETNTVFAEKESINTNDILETINHFFLFDYMLDIAKEEISEEIIKKFHEILKRGTIDSKNKWFNVGQYKKIKNEVGGQTTSKPENVSSDIKKLLSWYNSIENKTINEIIEFHVKFEKIHPFQDGNGRVGRIIAFKECLKNNIIPFIILDKDKAFYYRGLNEYENEKGYLVDTILNAQDQYKKLIDKFI